MANNNIFNLDGMKSGLIPPLFNGSYPPYFLGGRYSYNKKYEDSPLASKEIGTSENENSFSITGLDLENPQAGVKQGGSGGPNRTNSNNIPTGQFTNQRSPNHFGWRFKDEVINLGPNVTLNQWTPENKYMDSIQSIDQKKL